MLQGERNLALGVWSFGCLVFELVTGTPLFCIPGDDVFELDDYVLQLIDRIGPLPDHLFQAWPNASLYFTSERKLYNSQLGGVQEGSEPLLLDPETMEEFFDQTKPEIDASEAAQVKVLVRRILQYDPAQRPSAAEIVLDPWFEDSAETVTQSEKSKTGGESPV